MSNFNDNDLFCKKCFLHDTFFKGGGSWAIDICPECNDCETIAYKNMIPIERKVAKEKFDRYWKKYRMDLTNINK